MSNSLQDSTCSSNAEGWLDYQAKSSVDQVTLEVTVPRMRYPSHFKYTEEGTVATDDSYYYNDSIPWAGAVIDYLNAVVEISDIGGINYTSRSNIADKAYPESSYTASVHDISAGIGDVGGSTFWITSNRLSMTTFSTPIGVDRIHLFVKQPTQTKGSLRESAGGLFMPFTLNLWIFLFCVLFVTAIMVVYFDQSEGHEGIWSKKTSGPYWRQASMSRKIYILSKASLDSFIIHTSHMLGHAVEFDPLPTMALKILYFGFAVVIFISVAAYTANLAAFLTLSGTVDYVSSMEDAIASNTPVCVNPILEEEFSAAWPTATFIYNFTAEASGFEALMGQLAMYDAGKCGAIGYTDIPENQDSMVEFCKRSLVSTGSFILEKPFALPVRSEFAAGLSYWLYEAEKQGISYHFFHEQWLPSQVCNLRVTKVSTDVSELLSLGPANMMLPFLTWLCCLLIAVMANALRTRKKRTMQMRQETKNCDHSISTAPNSSSHIDNMMIKDPPHISDLSPKHAPSRRRSSHAYYHQFENTKEIKDMLRQHHMEMMEMMRLGTNNSSLIRRNNMEPRESDITVSEKQPGADQCNFRLKDNYGDDNLLFNDPEKNAGDLNVVDSKNAADPVCD